MLSVLQAVQLLRRKQKLRAPLRKLLAIAHAFKHQSCTLLLCSTKEAEFIVIKGNQPLDQLFPGSNYKYEIYCPDIIQSQVHFNLNPEQSLEMTCM